jgi:hypothetical protein
MVGTRVGQPADHQADVDDTTNEVTRFRPLLEGLDLAGRVVTADALHTQHTHAEWLVSVQQAACLLIVKANQPTLHHQLASLPWREILRLGDRDCLAAVILPGQGPFSSSRHYLHCTPSVIQAELECVMPSGCAG